MNKKIVYFLCTGNSCRSQMAEGFGRKYLPDGYTALSAGIERHGVNPFAVQVMAESGIDISNQISKVIDLNVLNHASLVVTLCDDAEERCPVTPSQVRRAHWGFPDPAKVTGNDAEKLSAFRSVRDGIRQRVYKLAKTIN